ncbi:MAG: glycosyltransferase family 2 protein, partial [Cytophagales bacterium]|nr:glycosyltransferase family 2 protein [Armatimonadota bacterium]
DDLRACLEALARYPFTGGDQEVIVVDNASWDGSAAMVRGEFPGVRLIANHANANYAKGTNQALATATGDYLLLLNPDARVAAGTLDTLTRFLAAHPGAGAVASKLVGRDGVVQRSVRGFPDPRSVLWDLLKLPRLFPGLGSYRQIGFNYEKAQIAPQPMASCFLLTRPAYEAVGPMDERFPLYFNDVDWCLRARKASLEVWYSPDAIAVHGYGGTTQQVRRAAVWESHRALLRLWGKHYRETTPRLFYVMMTGIVTLGAWARTGRWGESLGNNGGETTPENLHRELERAGGSARVSAQHRGGKQPP